MSDQDQESPKNSPAVNHPSSKSIKNFTREDYILLAKMAEQTERYDEMLHFVREFLKECSSMLSPDERYMFATAFKNTVGNRRAELRVLTALEQKEQRANRTENLNSIEQYKQKIEKELKGLCDELIELIDHKLLPNAKNPENEIFYKKMKADYMRYLAEFLEEEKCADIIDEADRTYKEADTLAKNELPPTHPLRLGLQLNMSVFYYEVKQKPGVAGSIAKAALEEAFANIDKIDQESFKDSTLIMQLIRDNLTLWHSETTEEIMKE